MKNLTWQNPEQLFVAQELINKVKSKCCGIKAYIIFTSDHGEMLGAHKMITKGYPYEECQKVPFIISGPGIKHGDKDNSVVCNGTDILPTMSELANIKVGRTDGISLAKRITNKGDIPEREAIRIENNNFYTIVSGSYKYS